MRAGATSIISLIAAAGCSSTVGARRPLSDRALSEVNDVVAGRAAMIAVKMDSQTNESHAAEIVVGREFTHFVDADPARRRRTVPTAALGRIVVRKHGRGAAEGLGLGLVIGIAAGAVAGAIIGSQVCWFDGGHGSCQPLTGVGAIAIGALGGLLGLVSGTIAGGIIGHESAIAFDPPEGTVPELVFAGDPCPAASIGSDVASATGLMLRCWDVFGEGKPRWTASE